jgi:hypothetical protein
MKETFYFQHDYNSRNDDKILQIRSSKFGNEGVAVFWYCCETMAERGDGYIVPSLIGGLSLGYGVAKEWLEEFLEFCLAIEIFKKDDRGLYSDRMVDHLKFRKSFSEHGRKGAKIRWKKAISPPNSPPNSGAYAKERKGKERKEKEKITKNIYMSILAEFNSLTGRRYCLTPARVKQLRGRLEIFTREDVSQAIRNRLEDPSSMGKNKDNKIWAYDWDSLFRNNENFDRALNLKGTVVKDDAFYIAEVQSLGMIKFIKKYGDKMWFKYLDHYVPKR